MCRDYLILLVFLFFSNSLFSQISISIKDPNGVGVNFYLESQDGFKVKSDKNGNLLLTKNEIEKLAGKLKFGFANKDLFFIYHTSLYYTIGREVGDLYLKSDELNICVLTLKKENVWYLREMESRLTD